MRGRASAVKLFDEKGKLFGKINIIDLLVIILIVVALVVVGVKVLGGNNGAASSAADSVEPSLTPEPPTAAKLTYTVRITALHEDIVEQLAQYVDPAEGKKEQLQHGGVLVEDAYVVDYWTEPCRYNVIASGEVETIAAAEADAAGLVNLCVVVEAVVDDMVSNRVGSLEVRIGKGHLVKTTHFEFTTGFVTACEWEPCELVED